jgi:hypothetical protein
MCRMDALLYLGLTRGICQNAGSYSEGLGGSQFLHSNKLPGDAALIVSSKIPDQSVSNWAERETYLWLYFCILP